MSDSGIIALNAASLLLVITFRMIELNIRSSESLLGLADYEIMTVLSPWLPLQLFKKTTEVTSCDILKWPKRTF